MSQPDKNRVTSSKTPRGSGRPNGIVGQDGIVQPAAAGTQPAVTMEALNRLLEVGRMLRSVLTPEELDALEATLQAGKRRPTTSSRRDQLISAALDAPDPDVEE